MRFSFSYDDYSVGTPTHAIFDDYSVFASTEPWAGISGGWPTTTLLLWLCYGNLIVFVDYSSFASTEPLMVALYRF